jgi:hypothetical protein
MSESNKNFLSNLSYGVISQILSIQESLQFSLVLLTYPHRSAKALFRSVLSIRNPRHHQFSGIGHTRFFFMKRLPPIQKKFWYELFFLANFVPKSILNKAS